MIAHRDEIYSRPKKTWFLKEKEKKLVAKEAKVISNCIFFFFFFFFYVFNKQKKFNFKKKKKKKLHRPAGPESKILGFTVVSSEVYFACSLCFKCINEAAISTFFVFSLQERKKKIF
jgi:hypothetical protein